MKDNFKSFTKFHVFVGKSNKWKEKHKDVPFTFIDDIK